MKTLTEFAIYAAMIIIPVLLFDYFVGINWKLVLDVLIDIGRLLLCAVMFLSFLFGIVGLIFLISTKF